MAVFQIVAPILKMEPKRQGVSQRTGNPWSSQTVVLDCSQTTQTGQTFYHYLAVDYFGDEKIALLNTLQPGKMVQVSFAVESRERQTQSGSTFWSTNINGIDIKPFVQQAPQPPMQQPQPQQQIPVQQPQQQAPAYQQIAPAYQQPPQQNPAQNYGQQPTPQMQQGMPSQDSLPF